MEKNEFLRILRDSLNGEIPAYAIDGHMRYYEEYLSNISDGKSEEEKLKQLGDPRLIARTIIDTSNIKIDPIQRKGQYDMYNNHEEGEEENQQMNDSSIHVHSFSWNSFNWYQKLLAIIIGVLVLIVVLSFIIWGVHLFFSVILPVLAVLLIVRLIISFSKKK